MTESYPETVAERDHWILTRRGARNQLDPRRPNTFHIEGERSESGEVVPVTTIFLTNRECPWHCLMCDLWKNTLTERVPAGAIPAQIDFALSELAKRRSAGLEPESSTDIRAASSHGNKPHQSESQAKPPASHQIKLYNSGSFFDRQAIPAEDYKAIAQRVARFERVIVECHPSLVGESALRFREILEAIDARKANPSSCVIRHRYRLEVAMGLETAHPEVLAKLNKRMTLAQFQRASEFLRENNIALRVFILVKPPFLDESEALHWARCSIDFAFDCGATVASLIPTRFGNDALEALARTGEFSPPKLRTLEAALDYGVNLKRGRVFADLWDLERFSVCDECFDRRRARLREINLEQVTLPAVVCGNCRSNDHPTEETTALR